MLTSWREGDCCFSHNQHYRQLMVLNNSNINNQIKLWKEAEREKNCKIRCLEGNNKKFTTDDGRDWYVLVVQQFSPIGEMVEMGQCPMALLLFGLMVSGYVYAFAEEETRNEMFKKINTRWKHKIEMCEKMTSKFDAMGEEEKQDILNKIFAIQQKKEEQAEEAEHRAKILLEKAEKKAKKLLEEQEAEEKAKKCFEELERMEEAEETKKASPKSKKEKKPKAQKPKTNPYPEMVSIAKDIWKKNPKWAKWEKENK